MSEWQVRVIKVSDIQKHSNADSLSIVNVDGGYPCIIRTGDFKEGDLAIYIPVDSIVPDTEEYAFLGGKTRIKAKRLRGVFSMGLLVPTKPGMKVGDIVDKELNITKYVPPMEAAGKGATLSAGYHPYVGENAPDHPKFHIYTDIESVRKNRYAIAQGEEVVATEKCHGTNVRYCRIDDTFYVGSHTKVKRRPGKLPLNVRFVGWLFVLAGFLLSFVGYKRAHKVIRQGKARLKDISDCVWWHAARKYDLEAKLAKAPNIILYGEVYGHKIQDLAYGAKEQEVFFRAFDAKDTNTNKYLDYDDFVKLTTELDIPIMPELYRGPWDYEKLYPMSNGKTTLGGDHVREGFVVRPIKERSQPGLGRVILKLVGEDYLLRKEK